VVIRQIEQGDRQQWRPLWQGYLDFYEVTLSEQQSDLTWERFFDSAHVSQGIVAQIDGSIVGIAHAMLRQSTWEPVGDLYIEDLFVAPSSRGQGIARGLIEEFRQQAQAIGAGSLYWQTRAGNLKAQALYDQIATKNDYIQYAIKTSNHKAK
jgi:GNAT superfamily N-acetyltransferase